MYPDKGDKKKMKLPCQLFNRLLSTASKWKFVSLIFLSAIAALLETLSISLVLPYILALRDPEAILENSWVQILSRWFPLNPENVIYVLSAGLALVFLLKNLYLWGLDVAKRKFVVHESFSTRKKVFRIYINKPYTYFLTHHSQDIANAICYYVTRAFGALQNLITFFSEILVLVLLMGLMIKVNAVVTLVVFAISGGFLLIMRKPLKSRLETLGQQICETHDRMTKSVSQSINGIREIKLLQLEDKTLEKFDAYRDGNENAEVMQTALLSVQNRMTEVLAIFAILICALLCIHTESADSMFTTLALVAMVMLRLRRGLNQIFYCLNYFSTCMLPLVRLSKIIDSPDTPQESAEEKPLPFQHTIQVQNLSYSYDGAHPVLKDVNMTIPKGSIIGLKGMSGGGKTTFANILLGLLQPDAGSVLVDGTDIREHHAAWFPLVSYIPQDIFLMDSTIRDNVVFFREQDDSRVWDALEKAQLFDFVKTLPDGLDTVVGEKGVRLSGGQRQRLGIARAVYQDAQVFIFDEPTAALDETLEKDIMDVVFSLENRTIILIAHRLHTLNRCDRIYEVGDLRIQEEDYVPD